MMLSVRMRSLTVVALLAGLWPLTVSAEDIFSGGDVFPRSLLNRYLPEPPGKLKLPAYLSREERAAAECNR